MQLISLQNNLLIISQSLNIFDMFDSRIPEALQCDNSISIRFTNK